MKCRYEAAGCKSLGEFLSDERKEELRELVRQERKGRHVSARKTNLANMGDVQKNSDKMQVIVGGI